jgi:hypothetical protein
MADLKNKLIETIISRVRETNRDIDLIIMHPQTWTNLCIECFSYNLNDVDCYNRKFQGIQVLRSFDVEIDLFTVK